MRALRITALVPMLILGSILTSGQQLSTIYYMNLPQNHLLNPALRSTNGVYIGLPAITGVNVNFNTNFIGFSDVFRTSATGDSVISVLHPDFDTDSFLEKIKKSNYLGPDINIHTLGLGFSAGKDLYIFLDVMERVSGGATLPGSVFELALKGNESFVGSTIDLTALDASFTYYREIGLGISKNITDRLRIGVRGKMLMGIAAMSMDTRSLGIEVLEDYSHRMTTDVGLNISGPVNVYVSGTNTLDSLVIDESRFEEPSFWLNMSNPGFGIDIGAEYRLTEQISLSAAFNGFGVINWKSDVTNLDADNDFLFSGFDLTDVIDGTRSFEEMAEELLDSLKSSFVISEQSTSFRTILPGTLSLGASYNLTDWFRLGVVSNTTLRNSRLMSSMMLSANANLGSGFAAGLSYTAINRSFDNIGAGLAFRAGVVQFYAVADKIPVMYNKVIIPQDSGSDPLNLILPDKWNTLTLRMGMNLVFGNRIKKKSDRPMMVTTEEMK